MRVLVISHNCISRTSNMGKTLYGYFQSFSSKHLAQFYLRNEVPGEDCLCETQYRFTDKDALERLLFCKKEGRIFPRDAEDTGKNWAAPLYRFGSRRTVLGCWLRELLWCKDPWNQVQYWKWVKEFDPDVIFFASGDYAFPYRMARETARRLGKPLVVCCVDDYYLHNRNGGNWLGRWLHRQFLGEVWKTMGQAAEIYTICKEMAQEYSQLFGLPCRVLHTPAALPEGALGENRQEIVYLGKLELGREENLISIGRTLQKLTQGRKLLQVYSTDRDEQHQMCPENGICFHGAVSAEQVALVMKNALAVVHTESFLPQFRKITRYSVSAKIPDALMAGPCLIAYGPEEVASMQYLKANEAAYCITSPEELEKGLKEILEKEGLQAQILENARALGRNNHGASSLRTWLENLCQGESL